MADGAGAGTGEGNCGAVSALILNCIAGGYAPEKLCKDYTVVLHRCSNVGRLLFGRLFFGFKFLQKKTFYISNVLTETVIFCVFNGQDTEKFTFEFRD